MKLIIASNNAGKVREIKQLIGDSFESVESLRDAGIVADVVEDGKTFTENARKKATEILRIAGEGYAVLADDSGLCVDALNGAPGVYSARFAGEGHNDIENNAKLLEELSNTPDEQRGARFVCAMVLLRHGLPEISVEGECLGVILNAPRGENGFGYDPLFFYPPFDKSFAELSAEEKNAVSHRSNALRKLQSAL